MRRLARQHSQTDQDRGAVAIIVALCLVVMIGLAAWVIDGSALYQERRELQNGADAAALAIARDCVLGACGDAYTTAEPYIRGNASDDLSRIASGGITYPDSTSVRVVVRTLEPELGADGDDHTVDYQFAPVLGRDGLEVAAVAVARWGSVGGGTTLPIVFSRCEFDEETNGNTIFESPPFSGTGSVIFFHTGNGGSSVPDDCAAQAGQDTDGDDRMPGGFGWLDQNECSANINEDDWVGAKPGNGPPQDCDPSDLLHQTILLPVFDDVTEQGGQGWANQCSIGPGGKCYHIYGFTAFYVTGFRFPGNQSWRQNPPCSAPDTCISGFFTEFIFAGGEGPGDTDLGAKTIWLES
jgi:hypothetical protein